MSAAHRKPCKKPILLVDWHVRHLVKYVFKPFKLEKKALLKMIPLFVLGHHRLSKVAHGSVGQTPTHAFSI